MDMWGVAGLAVLFSLTEAVSHLHVHVAVTEDIS